MKQTVDILERRTAPMLLMNAMAALSEGKKLDYIDLFQIKVGEPDSNMMQVEVTVNGVAVDFTGALQEGLDIIFDAVDQHVKDKALELLKEHPTLMNLQYELESADWKIRDALDKLVSS